MQSVLITACRGPDGIRKDHPVKVLIRFLRRSFLICAFDGKVRWSPYDPGGGSFTGPLHLRNPNGGEDHPYEHGHIDKFIEIYLRHVDELPHHFQLHLMHAAEILGYKHPDDDVRRFWLTWRGHYETAVGAGVPACRCYRCGSLLTVVTVTVDRVVPGCRGGTYRRDNIRPACARCNSETGAVIRRRA